MPSPRLPNYLRAHRKRLFLSQDDVAFLLGVQSGAKVSRYEGFVRQAGLETALAYEAIFEASVRTLFPGLYRGIEQQVVMRAKVLLHRIQLQGPKRNSPRKVQTLTRIAGRHSKQTLNQS